MGQMTCQISNSGWEFKIAPAEKRIVELSKYGKNQRQKTTRQQDDMIIRQKSKVEKGFCIFAN